MEQAVIWRGVQQLPFWRSVLPNSPRFALPSNSRRVPAGCPSLLSNKRKLRTKGKVMNSIKQIESITMKRRSSRSLGHLIRAIVAVVALLGFAWGLAFDPGAEMVGATTSDCQTSILNNHPAKNPGGKAA